MKSLLMVLCLAQVQEKIELNATTPQQDKAKEVAETAGPLGYYDPDTQMILWKDQRNPYAVVNAALWYGIQGDFDKSQAVYRQVIKKLELAQSNYASEYAMLLATAYHNYGVCELYRRRFDTAGAYFVKAIETKPLKPTLINSRLLLAGGLVKQKSVTDRLRRATVGQNATGPNFVVWSARLHPAVPALRKTSLQHLLTNLGVDTPLSRLESDKGKFGDLTIAYVIRDEIEIDNVSAVTDGTNTIAGASSTRISSTRIATTYDVRVSDDFIPLVACIRCAGKGVEDCPNPGCRRGQIIGKGSVSLGKDLRGEVGASGTVTRKQCSTCRGQSRVKCTRCSGSLISLGG